MYYKAPDNSVHFLDSSEYEYMLPVGTVAITDADAAALRPAPPPTPTPQSVTRFQARAALVQAGHFDAVDALMSGLPQTDLRRMAWDDAAQFERTSATLIAMQGLLGLSDAEVDALFVTADAIRA